MTFRYQKIRKFCFGLGLSYKKIVEIFLRIFWVHLFFWDLTECTLTLEYCVAITVYVERLFRLRGNLLFYFKTKEVVRIMML